MCFQGLEKLVKFYASDPVAQEKAKGELAEQRSKVPLCLLLCLCLCLCLFFFFLLHLHLYLSHALQVQRLRDQKKEVEKQLSELLGAEYKADADETYSSDEEDKNRKTGTPAPLSDCHYHFIAFHCLWLFLRSFSHPSGTDGASATPFLFVLLRMGPVPAVLWEYLHLTLSSPILISRQRPRTLTSPST